jgi:hypothetical protein
MIGIPKTQRYFFEPVRCQGRLISK